MSQYNHHTEAPPLSNYESFSQCEGYQWQDVNLEKENRRTISMFRTFGLWSLKRKGRKYIVNEVSFTLSRLTWFLWHLLAVIFTMWIKFFIKDTDMSMGTKVNKFKFGAIGIFMFIIVDPVQTNILKRNLQVIPKILNMVRNMEGMKLGHISLSMEGASRVYMYRQKQREKSFMLTLASTQNHQPTDDDDSDIEYKKGSGCEGWLTDIITYIFLTAFFVFYGVGFAQVAHWNDIKDEWKFAGMMFCLPFPVLTTWFCMFLIGYQRKMLMILTELDNEVYKDQEHVKTIGKYLETMQHISKVLCDDIYRFTFGINFCIFVVIATSAMFEYFQGVNEMPLNEENMNGDIIYIIPISVTIFHIYISCHRSTDLIRGQHDTLRYKLKAIIVDLLMDGQDKPFKKVEILYKNVKDFSPMPQVFGGWRVNYQILVAMMIFIFSYARVFYRLTDMT